MWGSSPRARPPGRPAPCTQAFPAQLTRLLLSGCGHSCLIFIGLDAADFAGLDSRCWCIQVSAAPTSAHTLPSHTMRGVLFPLLLLRLPASSHCSDALSFSTFNTGLTQHVSEGAHMLRNEVLRRWQDPPINADAT